MKEQLIQTHVLKNGLTLIVEQMADVQSAAFSILLPSGSVFQPRGYNGTAAILCDLITRGAGDLNTQQLSDVLDNLGLQRHESVGNYHLTLSGATLATNLIDALHIYRDIVLNPWLPEDQFEAARAGVAQMLQAQEDEPRQKLMVELRRRTYPAPWGLPSDGQLSELINISLDTVKQHQQNCFRPNETIIGIAGAVEPQAMIDEIEKLFGDWEPKQAPSFDVDTLSTSFDHIPHDSTQTHIGISYESVPYQNEDYYDAWAAVSVLSGGMSARLFTEVREKRGLCYSVSAMLSSLKNQARVLCYAGTTSERAQETLDVTVHELQRLGRVDGQITKSELDRCKARAKSSLIMQQESTIARSSSIAKDWYHLERVNSLSDVRDKIERLTIESVSEYLNHHPAEDFTIVTIGPESLESPREVSSNSVV